MHPPHPLSPVADDGAMAPLVPASLASQVADRLVEAVAQGRIEPGQRLYETELATELGVSRIPIREALRLLEGQGLLVARHHRGIRVIALDEAWAQQLYELRIAIERVALRHAAQAYAREPDRLKALDRIIAQMHDAAAAGDRDAVNLADLAFHETVCAESGSPLLVTLWQAIRRHLRILFAREADRDSALAAVPAQHQQLRALLAAGDEAALDRAIEAHIMGARWPAGGRAAASPRRAKRAR